MAIPVAPKVILERSGGQVRLRGMKYALPVCINTEKHGEIRANIQPNTWTKVPSEVYDFLKSTFDTPRYTSIPDVEANEQNPHKAGDSPQMTLEEVDPQFYLEFRKS